MARFKPIVHISKIRLPEKSLFNAEINELLNESTPRSRYKISESRSAERLSVSRFLVEGLYQIYAMMNSDIGLAVPMSQSAYAHDIRLKHFNYRYMYECVMALERIGWVTRSPGYKFSDGEGVLTTIRPIGNLLSVFEHHGILWQRLLSLPREQTIFLREKVLVKTLNPDTNKINTTRKNMLLATPRTNKVSLMQANLLVINEHISNQAICLCMQNESLRSLAKDVARKDNPTISFFGDPKKKSRHINFYDVRLHRVFSKGSRAMDLGGRFYGGWWQVIPSKYRPYITINGLPTEEVDFSHLHPRLLYAQMGITPPDGDLYDFGYRLKGYPTYDPKVEPYKSVREINKSALNAYLNDERDSFRLKEEMKVLIKMTTSQLFEQMLLKHPTFIGKQGVGLEFQYIDSQIAEQVMLDLIDIGITCLPVHDSFIVQLGNVGILEQAMNRAYLRFSKTLPKLKYDGTVKESEFPLPLTPEGRVNMKKLQSRYEGSIHELYVESWYKQNVLGRRR